MREGQVPPARAGTRKEGQREKEAERERETEGPAHAQRGASSGGVARPWRHQGWPHREDTRGGGYQLDPVGVGRRRGRAGRVGHISTVQARAKCELGVSIGNSAFTFLLHFYFKHRKRERKQIEKKCARKKEKKKRLNCFRFLSGNMPPFPFFPHPGSPTPNVASAQPPPPSPFLWGECPGDSHREGKTREDRDQERQGGGGVQTGRWTEPSDGWGHPQCSGGWGGGASAGRWALVRGAPGRTWQGWKSHTGSPPPHNPPAALLLEPGAKGEGVQCLQGPGRPQLREHAELLPSLCWPC